MERAHWVGMCAAFMDGACGQDAVLRQEVESLLEHHRLAEFESYSRTRRQPKPYQQRSEDQIGRLKKTFS
jgi:hypothetical protein